MKALATALMVTATLVGMSAAHADGKTREQVQQELQAAKAAGQVTFGELDYPPAAAERVEQRHAVARHVGVVEIAAWIGRPAMPRPVEGKARAIQHRSERFEQMFPVLEPAVEQTDRARRRHHRHRLERHPFQRLQPRPQNRL